MESFDHRRDISDLQFKGMTPIVVLKIDRVEAGRPLERLISIIQAEVIMLRLREGAVESSEKYLDSEYILKVKLTGFAVTPTRM